jgi:hypothetical protein
MPGAAAAAAAAALLLLTHAAAGSGSCERTCGALTVRYPFGFSPGCGIRLGCDQAAGTAWLGAAERELGLQVSNVTARAIFLALHPVCSRRRRLDASVDALFSDNYAPTSQVELLVSSCNRTTTLARRNCSVQPPRHLTSSSSSSSSHCFRGAKPENVSCVSAPSGNRFLNRSEMLALGSECTGLVSAAASYSYTPAPAPSLGVMELEWWMLGPCRCSAQANCSSVSTPAGRPGFRCECLQGFEGDGFADGAGCLGGQCAPPSAPTALISLFIDFVRTLDPRVLPVPALLQRLFSHWLTLDTTV